MLEQQQLALARPLADDERRDLFNRPRCHKHNHHSQQRKLSICDPIAPNLACV